MYRGFCKLFIGIGVLFLLFGCGGASSDSTTTSTTRYTTTGNILYIHDGGVNALRRTEDRRHGG